jgi:hypothetical protein
MARVSGLYYLESQKLMFSYMNVCVRVDTNTHNANNEFDTNIINGKKYLT